jgi:hypothetical protein
MAVSQARFWHLLAYFQPHEPNSLIFCAQHSFSSETTAITSSIESHTHLSFAQDPKWNSMDGYDDDDDEVTPEFMARLKHDRKRYLHHSYVTTGILPKSPSILRSEPKVTATQENVLHSVTKASNNIVTQKEVRYELNLS